jgi:hypothetical protein
MALSEPEAASGTSPVSQLAQSLGSDAFLGIICLVFMRALTENFAAGR